MKEQIKEHECGNGIDTNIPICKECGEDMVKVKGDNFYKCDNFKWCDNNEVLEVEK